MTKVFSYLFLDSEPEGVRLAPANHYLSKKATPEQFHSVIAFYKEKL